MRKEDHIAIHKPASGFMILMLAILSFYAGAQNKKLDSLRLLINNNARQDTNKVKELNQFAYQIYPYDLKQLTFYSVQALALAKKLNYKKGEAIAYRNMALSQMLVHGEPVALAYLDTALQILAPLHDDVNTAAILNSIGCYYATVKDNDQAIIYFDRALSKLQGQDVYLEAVILNNIGNHYGDMGELDKARVYYNRVIAISTQAHNDNGLSTGYDGLASLYFKQGDYQQAISYCNRELAIGGDAATSLRGKQSIYTLLGEINYKLKTYDKAGAFFMQAASVARQMKSTEGMDNIYHGLYLIDSVQGNYAAALKEFSQYQQVKDSITNADKNRMVALYQVKFELDKHKSENRELKIIAEKNQTIIDHQHTSLSIALFSIIVICVGLIYLEQVNKQVRAKNKIINRQNELLDENNRAKDILFSVIAHDLRRPMSLVIQLLDVWEEGDLQGEKLTERKDAVKKVGLSTLDMLDNLLVWSKSQLKGFAINPAPFEVRNMVVDILKKMQQLTIEKEITVINNIPVGSMVYADSGMMTVVLRNLISNAIKFTPEKGIIKITCEHKDGKAIIGIIDSGMGIKAEDQHKLFSYTFTTLGTFKEKGTGLGLKICWDFITLNQGNIWMESKENVGSKFFISLPLNK